MNDVRFTKMIECPLCGAWRMPAARQECVCVEAMREHKRLMAMPRQKRLAAVRMESNKSKIAYLSREQKEAYNPAILASTTPTNIASETLRLYLWFTPDIHRTVRRRVNEARATLVACIEAAGENRDDQKYDALGNLLIKYFPQD